MELHGMKRRSISSRSWSRRLPHSTIASLENLWYENQGGLGLGQYEEVGFEKCSNKSLMVVVDASHESRNALLWTLSHLVEDKDTLILLHVSEPSKLKHTLCSAPSTNNNSNNNNSNHVHLLTSSLKSLCKTTKPEVNVKVVVTKGEHKGATIVKHAKKLAVSVLVIGQRRPSLLRRFFRSKREQEVVNYCIQYAECLTLAISKQSSSIGGYLINSKWHKNFWLLA